MKKEIFTNKYSSVLLALLVAVLWGSAFPTVKAGYALFSIAAEDISAKLVYAGIRFFSAGVIDMIIGVIMYKHFMLPKKNYAKAILTLGIIQTFCQYLFFYIAIGNMAGSKGSVINSMGTFLTVLLAHFFYANDRLDKKKILGCALGIAGIIVINLGGDMGSGFKLAGDGVMLLAALSCAMGNVLTKKIAKGLDSVWLTAYHLAFGGLMLLIVGLCTGGRIHVVSFKAIVVMAYLASLSAVSFIIWMMLLKYNPVGKISIFTALVPICGTYLSGIILKENVFTLINLIALVLVAGGIFVINYQKSRR